MNKICATIVVLLGWLISASAVAWQHEHTLYGPIQVGNYIEDPKPLIIAGIKRYGWIIDDDAEQALHIRYQQEGVEVEAVIRYDSESIRFEAAEPKSLADCKDCEVFEQSRYWLVNLRRAIALELHAMAIADAGGEVEGRYYAPNLDSFRGRIASEDARVVVDAARDISRGYVHERAYLDLAAARAWELRNSSDGHQVSAAAHIVKALARSDGARYRKMIEAVKAEAPDARLQKHAEAALATIIQPRRPVESYIP